MARQCFALDLQDDPALIAEYEHWHEPDRVWPEVIAALAAAGMRDLEIFRVDDRLFMIMDVPENYSSTARAAADAHDPRVQAWEALMWKFQKPLPGAEPGEKWRPMKRIFSLAEATKARR